jgi:hypothetical protein
MVSGASTPSAILTVPRRNALSWAWDPIHVPRRNWALTFNAVSWDPLSPENPKEPLRTVENSQGTRWRHLQSFGLLPSLALASVSSPSSSLKRLHSNGLAPDLATALVPALALPRSGTPLSFSSFFMFLILLCFVDFFFFFFQSVRFCSVLFFRRQPDRSSVATFRNWH